MSDRLIVVATMLFAAALIQYVHYRRKRQIMHFVVSNGAVLLGCVVLVGALFPALIMPVVVAAVFIAVVMAILMGIAQAENDIRHQAIRSSVLDYSPVLGGACCIVVGVAAMARLGIVNGISLIMIVIGVTLIITSLRRRPMDK